MPDKSKITGPVMVNMMKNETTYPHGLRISLSLEQMKELGADTTPPMGLKLYLEAKAKVVSISTNESMNAGCKGGYVEFQITDVMLHSPEFESEEEEKERKKKRSPEKVMYG